MTNYERIKSMTQDELIDVLFEGSCHFCFKKKGQTCGMNCKQAIKQYLEKEAGE